MSDTQTTTEIPTPAQDALRAAKAEHDNLRGDFMSREVSRLNSEASKDEMLAAALKAEPWLQKSKVTTKDKAIRIVVRHMWEQTDTHQTLNALEEAASVERRLFKRSEQAAERVELARSRVLEVAGKEWDAERTIDRVATLRQEAVEQQHWDEVLEVAKARQIGPVEALKVVFAGVQKDMLIGRNHRVMSRSTSLSTNLVTDLDTEAKISWMDDANDLLRGL